MGRGRQKSSRCDKCNEIIDSSEICYRIEDDLILCRYCSDMLEEDIARATDEIIYTFKRNCKGKRV